ncbi:uncharacterized protein KNAG_0E01550 [Huiozyma naganishii CBS 8797]|uniref:Uncharacterized protein n=1 Tax=Huiozyma naganishii (strain ATCC MYA-139 / BCRC 22969 / CBS 8797 / KCTC 17520 / NBRC 10181 / NCYC 3082 / Yp74L-3) TaxID=1071383 RepID=J7RLK9_HUIN7|nr:hypothetical protein KNAG_0E01550 [Kazachstania naganishii CBS 8797]CCK70418.1 hypothetical protein KNAG_0E01550 [Kazachstania naganishii CBS 8797]
MIKEQERKNCEALTKENKESGTYQPRKGCMFSSETPRSKLSTLATANLPSVIPTAAKPSSKSEVIKIRSETTVTEFPDKAISTLSINTMANTPSTPRSIASTIVPICESQPIYIKSSKPKAYPPNEPVFPRPKVATSPNSMCTLEVSERSQGVHGEEERIKYYVQHDFEEDVTLLANNLFFWNDVGRIVKQDYAECKVIRKRLRASYGTYRKRGINRVKNKLKTKTKVLFGRLFKGDKNPDPAPEHHIENLEYDDPAGFTAAAVKYYTTVIREEKAWRKYAHSLGKSSRYDTHMRQNMEANHYNGSAANAVRTIVNEITENVWEKMSLIHKYHENNIHTLTQVKKDLQRGYEMRFVMEHSKNPALKRKVEAEYQLFKERELKNLHQVLQKAEDASKEHMTEVQRFSRIIAQKKALYKGIGQLDCRDPIEIKLRDSFELLKSLFVRW